MVDSVVERVCLLGFRSPRRRATTLSLLLKEALIKLSPQSASRLASERRNVYRTGVDPTQLRGSEVFVHGPPTERGKQITAGAIKIWLLWSHETRYCFASGLVYLSGAH